MRKAYPPAEARPIYSPPEAPGAAPRPRPAQDRPAVLRPAGLLRRRWRPLGQL